MQQLLRTAERHPAAGECARRLLADARRAPTIAPVIAADRELSDRELEVLRLLASDPSGPQIAQHLFVSVNTLRKHQAHLH